jgi:hypothetical protein
MTSTSPSVLSQTACHCHLVCSQRFLVGMALAEPRKTDSAVMVVNQNAMTPLHVAAGEGHLDVVRPILALIPDSFQGGQVNGAGESMCASPDEMTNKHWVLL